MVSLDPMWSKPVKVSERAMDPLGMNRVSDRITNEILTGITTMTQRGRYYSFYIWNVYNLNKLLKITKFSEFAKAFYDRERAFMIACIAHQESSKDPKLDHSSILGSDKGVRFWRESGKNVEMSFKFLANRLGGYGYYYQASLASLGLTAQEEVRDVVTELGEKLALAFEQFIKNTEYFKKYIERETIPKNVLLEYGRKCCLCMLKKNTSERDLLIEILFGLNEELKGKSLHERRRETLSLILYLTHKASKKHLELDKQNFLNVAYFRQMKENDTLIDLDTPDYFDDTLARWKMFTSHDFFSYACESLFSAFLEMLEKHSQTGLSLEQFLDIVNDKKSITVLSSLLHTNFKARDLRDINIRSAIESINKLVTRDTVGLVTNDVSEKFDKECNLQSSLNESSLAQDLEELFEKEVFDVYAVATKSLLLLLLLYTRFYHYWKKVDEHWVWLSGQTGRDLSPARLIHDLEKKMKIENFTLLDFLKWFITEYVIHQAEEIAAEKSLNILVSRPIFWFHPEGLVYIKDRDYSPKHRNSRFYSCHAILKDLGLSEFTGEYTELTQDGIKMLQSLVGKVRSNGVDDTN